MDLSDAGRSPSSLDSKLLINWAPSLHTLTVDEVTLRMPGLATFGREATQLQTLRVIWLPPAAAAELGQLFQSGSFSSITKLVGICSHIPVLPSGLQHLKVDVWGFQRQTADELIGNLRKLGLALQSLSINLLEENCYAARKCFPRFKTITSSWS